MDWKYIQKTFKTRGKWQSVVLCSKIILIKSIDCFGHGSHCSLFKLKKRLKKGLLNIFKKRIRDFWKNWFIIN